MMQLNAKNIEKTFRTRKWIFSKKSTNVVDKVYTLSTNKKEHKVLDIDSLSIEKGEIFCILGPNGCGKTTLLNILAGFEISEKGTVAINGKLVDKPDSKFISIFQDHALLSWRTALENVRFGLEATDMNEIQIEKTARKYIKLVDLEGFENNYPDELSGGMKQRVSLARALAIDPDILFMDEPFGSLDEFTRIKMQKELLKIWSVTNKTIVFVTHNIDEALTIADRIAIMSSNPGKIKRIFELKRKCLRNRTDKELVLLKKEIYKEFGLN